MGMGDWGGGRRRRGLGGGREAGIEWWWGVGLINLELCARVEEEKVFVWGSGNSFLFLGSQKTWNEQNQ